MIFKTPKSKHEAKISLNVISVIGGNEIMATLVQINENDQKIMDNTIAIYILSDLNITKQ